MRAVLPPVTLLILLACLAVWNAKAIADRTEQCVSGVDEAIHFADAGDWPSVMTALSDSHRHWQSSHSYLRITVAHSMVDAADSMYCRALAFAETEELTEFRAETAGLRVQLLRIAENERLCLENIF